MKHNEGPTFQIAEGNLTAYEFGELISRIWHEAYPSVPFYQYGTSHDDVDYPSITWRVLNRSRIDGTGVKNRTVDEFVGDDNEVRNRKSGFFRTVLEFRISAIKPKEANQIVEAFEFFIEQYAGDFKRSGIRDLFYVERRPDNFEKIDGKVVSRRLCVYEIHEESVFITGGPLVERIEVESRILLKARQL